MEIATLRPDLDKEWVELIKEAKSIGLRVSCRLFLQSTMKQ